jgi:hypothetical protein
MARNGTPRRRPDAPSAPTTLTEIARRYYACAIALAKAMGLPMSETFVREHRESISCCFIEAGRAGVRLPPAVQLPPLTAPPAAATNGQAPDASTTEDTVVSRQDRPPAAPSANGSVTEQVTVVTSPTTIPTDAGLPCGGQRIDVLKPAQLAMLISKTARLVQDEGEAWVPLLHALQAERAARLAKGRKVPAPTHGEG